MDERTDIVIIPTGGTINADGRWQPTEHGKKRAIKILELWNRGKISAVAVLGGRRNNPEASEAVVYREFMYGLCPEFRSAKLIVDASSTCTNRDIPVAIGKINDYLESRGIDRETAKIAVVTYEKHFDRIEIVLRHLGFSDVVFLDSGEPRAYSPIMEWLLTAITRLDPEWRWLGWPLVWLANRRAKLSG